MQPQNTVSRERDGAAGQGTLLHKVLGVHPESSVVEMPLDSVFTTQQAEDLFKTGQLLSAPPTKPPSGFTYPLGPRGLRPLTASVTSLAITPPSHSFPDDN